MSTTHGPRRKAWRPTGTLSKWWQPFWMIENLWKEGSGDWEPFGKKGEQNDEQDQEPLEKRYVFQPPTTNLWKKDIAFA